MIAGGASHDNRCQRLIGPSPLPRLNRRCLRMYPPRTLDSSSTARKNSIYRSLPFRFGSHPGTCDAENLASLPPALSLALNSRTSGSRSAVYGTMRRLMPISLSDYPRSLFAIVRLLGFRHHDTTPANRRVSFSNGHRHRLLPLTLAARRTATGPCKNSVRDVIPLMRPAMPRNSSIMRTDRLPSSFSPP